LKDPVYDSNQMAYVDVSRALPSAMGAISERAASRSDSRYSPDRFDSVVQAPWPRGSKRPSVLGTNGRGC
jgi:hypothetical protein